MRRREILTAVGALAVAGGATVADAQPGEMHPPKYKALEDSTAKCVSTGEDCLRHCLGMLSMKDTTMAGCANSVVQLVAACRALQTLASVNSTFTPAFAKDVGRSAPLARRSAGSSRKSASARACADACKTCADECHKVAA